MQQSETGRHAPPTPGHPNLKKYSAKTNIEKKIVAPSIIQHHL